MDFENALRPLRFADFAGQGPVVQNLKVFVEAARYRGEPLDHTLLHGPPGLGKTTLSNIIANELGVGFKITSGPVLDKPGDLAGILTSLEPQDVLFIDEIHRLSPVVEEYLYSAMEDYRIDIMIDRGPSARSIQIDLNPFTLVGATTRSGLLTAPLRARFGINLHLEYYDAETLTGIVLRSAGILQQPIDEEAAAEIARRSRGTPRIANALLHRFIEGRQTLLGNGGRIAVNVRDLRMALGNSVFRKLTDAVRIVRKDGRTTIEYMVNGNHRKGRIDQAQDLRIFIIYANDSDAIDTAGHAVLIVRVRELAADKHDIVARSFGHIPQTLEHMIEIMMLQTGMCLVDEDHTDGVALTHLQHAGRGIRHVAHVARLLDDAFLRLLTDVGMIVQRLADGRYGYPALFRNIF